MSINVKTNNKKAVPYNLQSDKIQIKVVLYENNDLSYMENIPVKVYHNFEGIDTFIGIYYTDEYGVCTLTYNTDLITQDIDTGIMWATIDYDNKIYKSNNARVNFIEDTAVILEFIILDAGGGPDRNDNLEGIYDADLVDPGGATRSNAIVIKRGTLND